MRCFYPVVLKTESRINPVRIVSCGKCLACLQKKRWDWFVRVSQEMKNYKSAYFVTLTYSDENLVYGWWMPTLCKRDIQLFIKKARKRQYKRSFRYIAVGEYGPSTNRPHYHLIIFADESLKEMSKIIEHSWDKGFTKVAKSNPKTINYVLKDMMHGPVHAEDRQEQFYLFSKNPGIGFNYINDEIKKFHINNGDDLHINGRRHKLPKYYVQKIWTDKELRQKRSEKIMADYKKRQKEFEKQFKTGEDYLRYLIKEQNDFEAKMHKQYIKLKGKI